MKQQGFLPATKEELRERGITQPDFVYVIGDAYVDRTVTEDEMNRAGVGKPRLQRGDPGPAGLEGSKEHSSLWRAAPGLPGLLRKYGFYGKSLFRVEKTPED